MAFAHADLLRVSPGDGQVLKRSPETVVLTFDEGIEPAFVRLQVQGADGRQVARGAPYHPDGREEQLAVRLQPGLEGRYSASYRVISEDGHPVRRRMTFAVRPPAPPADEMREQEPTDDEGAMPPAEDGGAMPRAGEGPAHEDGESGAVTSAAFAVARGLGYLAMALAVGGIVFLLVVWLPAVRQAAGAATEWSGCRSASPGAPVASCSPRSCSVWCPRRWPSSWKPRRRLGSRSGRLRGARTRRDLGARRHPARHDVVSGGLDEQDDGARSRRGLVPSTGVKGRAQARLRTTALLGVGALAVHELRYRIAFGDDAQSALAASGHGYLGAVAPVVALVAMAGLASLVHRIASGAGTARVRRGGIWLSLTAGLLAIFSMQELLEALFATGHPDGFHGVFGDGGWLAIPLSMAVAAIAVVFIRLAAATVFEGVATSFIVLRPLPISTLARPFETRRRRPPLLRHLAGRAPPLSA